MKLVIEIIKTIIANAVFVNFDNLIEVKNSGYLCAIKSKLYGAK